VPATPKAPIATAPSTPTEKVPLAADTLPAIATLPSAVT
jgi:hypothetical protein